MIEHEVDGFIMGVEEDPDETFGREELVMFIPSWSGKECPIDLERATAWERQEIVKAWHDAMKAANNLARCGAHYSEMLSRGGKFEADGYVGSLDMGGDYQPVYAANKFNVAAMRLKGLVDGMTHRISRDDFR